MASKYRVTYEVTKTESHIVEVDSDDLGEVCKRAYEFCKTNKEINSDSEISLKKIEAGKMYPVMYFDCVESLLDEE